MLLELSTPRGPLAALLCLSGVDIFSRFVNPLLAAAATALAGVTRGHGVGLNSQSGAVLLDELGEPQRWGEFTGILVFW